MPETTSTARAGASIHRQPIVHPDRSVFAYAVRGRVLGPDGVPLPEASAEHLVDAAYSLIDPDLVAGTRPLVVRATRRLLADPTPFLGAPHGLTLELPPTLVAEADVRARLGALAEADVRVALADYTASPEQDALLPHVQLVKVDAAADPAVLADLVARAVQSGTVVIAERATTRERVQVALDVGAELLQGPLVLNNGPTAADRAWGVSEIQCLELLRLLSEDAVDQREVIRVVQTDPVLTVRVLHLVNSSAMGVRNKVDSVRQAVVLLGPRHLGALATASLVGATPASMEALWYLLTRASACGGLAGDDVGYTVGLLSAVSSYLRVPAANVVADTGVSSDVADALLHRTGRYGPVLAAVLAHEANDADGVRATGLDEYEVAHAYLDAVPRALALASNLAAAA
ncbi:EAL and HDOD domain-containing protein [Cellulomonas telluris]|uniref:EAL and HDOD domain-containing protein n=1 Tax=Cellulomonas telluris TaxID=2306636 RepID=UPI0010A7AE64|nr:HDOD domain-containing protein [Cellulomonas telluris]